MKAFSLGPLAVWHHPAEGTCRGTVIVVHGICEHSGRHLHTVQALAAKGWDVVRFDLRGAGKSSGRRQWIATFQDYIEDLSSVFRWTKENSSSPIYLMGHSLGGAIAVHFAATSPEGLNGLVVTAPAYLVGNGISPLKIAVGRMLVRFFPTLRVPDTAEKTAVSRDPTAVKAYMDDPLCCHFNTLQQGDEILKALPNMPTLCRSIQIPVLIAHGSMDKISRLEGSMELVKCLGSKDKTLHVLPGYFHEPHNDIGKEEFFQVVALWLSDRARRL